MTKPESRIQKRNQSAILAAGLKVFSQYGFRGSTLDQIAKEAGLSKPNLIYYFPSKDNIYKALLDRLLENWMEPIYQIDATGDPVEELVGYAKRKLEMSRNYPDESRLFANEIIQGAPQIGDACLFGIPWRLFAFLIKGTGVVADLDGRIGNALFRLCWKFSRT